MFGEGGRGNCTFNSGSCSGAAHGNPGVFMGARQGLEHESQLSGVEGCVGVSLLTLRAESQTILQGFSLLVGAFQDKEDL